MRSVLFYDDAQNFGGHQVTAVEAVRFLVENTNLKVNFMVNRVNDRLIKSLTALNQSSCGEKVNLNILENMPSLKSVILNPILLSFTVHKLAQETKSINPDLFIAVQGSVYFSFIGLLAAKYCGFKTISFIPMGIKRDKSEILKSIILDGVVGKFIYSLPDSFITIAESAKSKLIANGVKQKIEVIYYGANVNNLIYKDRIKERESFQIDPTEYVIAVVGRINFRHKAQDFLVKSLLAFPNLPDNLRLYIVGDGSDIDNLIKIIESEDIKKIIKFLPWTNDLTQLYSAIDMLVIPSWYEGLPIVMLEAMYYNLPIVASDVDGMSEILPNEWLFKRGDGKSLVETIIKVMNADNKAYINNNRNLIVQKHNLQSFVNNFHKHIIKIIA